VKTIINRAQSAPQSCSMLVNVFQATLVFEKYVQNSGF